LAQYSIIWSDERDSDNVAFAFSTDELNIYFISPAAGIDPPDLAHVTYRPHIEGDSFSFSCIEEVCVVAGLDGINGIPLVFIKHLLPLILPFFSFNLYFFNIPSCLENF
jgi:hypothetical protein